MLCLQGLVLFKCYKEMQEPLVLFLVLQPKRRSRASNCERQLLGQHLGMGEALNMQKSLSVDQHFIETINVP